MNPTAAYTDGRGRVWIGYDDGTIVYLDDGSIRTLVTGEDSPVGKVTAIRGRNRQVWIGGTSGLALFDGTRLRSIVPSDAPAFGNVSGMEETTDGGLWLRESRGVIDISPEELHKFLETPTYRVHYELFDSLDGLPGRFELNVNQGEVLDSKGGLWFVGTDGIASLDPASTQRKSFPPSASIRAVLADGKSFPSQDDPVLPALTGRIEIDYAGVNLSTPEQVRSRYRLEGTDKDWQDAGTSRQASYTNLAPGKHRFHLNARNVGGEWNTRDTILEFSVAPAWFQTAWFRASCLSLLCFILWGLYRMRVRQVAYAMSVRFDERLSERTRLARDLHDTLLQTIQGSKYVADSALRRSEEANPMRGSLEELSAWLGQAIEEGRAALNSLRTSTNETNDLSEAFRRSTTECRIHSSIEASLSVVGEVSEMHPILRDEVYRIGHEAIHNACAHSQATQLQVELTYAEDLILRVDDNGVGIDPTVVSEGKHGHFGLQGMRERAARIMAKLEVESSAGAGTKIKLIVPGSIIYRNTNWKRGKFPAIKSFLKRMGLTSSSTDL